jgi:integral membrane sensor domain MASE1
MDKTNRTNRTKRIIEQVAFSFIPFLVILYKAYNFEITKSSIIFIFTYIILVILFIIFYNSIKR